MRTLLIIGTLFFAVLGCSNDSHIGYQYSCRCSGDYGSYTTKVCYQYPVDFGCLHATGAACDNKEILEMCSRKCDDDGYPVEKAVHYQPVVEQNSETLDFEDQLSCELDE